MRIIIHSDEYYPTAQACSYRMQVFTDTFIAEGDEVVVITSSTNKLNGIYEKGIHKEKIVYTPTIRMKKKTTIMRLLNNLSFAINSIFSSLFIGKADVVITTSPPPLISISGWIISKLKRAVLVYDVRDIWPDVALEMGSFEENSLFCKTFKRVTSFMYKHSDIITTVSPGKVNKLKMHVSSITGKKAGVKNTDKVWLVGNGFDENVLKLVEDKSIIEKYKLDQFFTCVYIGNIGLAQGIGVILDVAKQSKHKNIQFLCFGMGAEKEKLEDRVQQEKIDNVHFCGVIDHSKVFTILSNAKLSFIPLKSSKMKDSVPTKIYESLGIGCPVLLVAEGDSADIVDEVGLGRHISPEDTSSFVDVFDEMVTNYQIYEQKRELAKNVVVDKFSRQRISLAFRNRLIDYLNH